MNSETSPKKVENCKPVQYRAGSSEAVYGLGLIGAWVFYFSHVATWQDAIWAFFKGILWPGFLVYQVLDVLSRQ